jgi:hypothetical protein
LKSQSEKKTTIDLDDGSQLYQVNHLLIHRIGPTPSKGQVIFETGLRTYGVSEFKEREKKWSTVPHKDKKDELPRLYPSYEDTLKIKTWSTKNLQIKTYPAL